MFVTKDLSDSIARVGNAAEKATVSIQHVIDLIEKDKTILLDNGLSGINYAYYDLLKSVNSSYIGCEIINWVGGGDQSIPTYTWKCPNCNTDNKWRTTGIIPLSVQCKNCKQEFKP